MQTFELQIMPNKFYYLFLIHIFARNTNNMMQ